MTELDRLFAELVRVLRDVRPDQLTHPLEVAELLGYVPYRTVRAAIGTETNDDYAHVVMRLLSGEGGYLLADEMLQDDMRNELSSPNPNLAVYRSYLNAHVTLSPTHTQQVLAGLPSRSPAAVMPAPDRVVTNQTERDLSALAAALADVAAAPVRVDERPRPHPLGACTHCGHPLPDGRDAHFCPHCGRRMLVRRCAGCSSELEAGWKFCITCGRASS